MDAARNTRSTVKKLSSQEQRIQTCPVTGKVDIEKGSLQAFESRLKLPTSKPPPFHSRVYPGICVYPFSFFFFFLFPSFSFFSLAPRKKARPSFASFVFIKQRVQDSISLRAVFARKNNFRRWTRGGGRGSFVRNSRFVPSCQREHFFVFFY